MQGEKAYPSSVPYDLRIEPHRAQTEFPELALNSFGINAKLTEMFILRYTGALFDPCIKVPVRDDS